MTVRDSYPLLRMEACIDSLEKARIFSTIYANFRHCQIEINERDRSKTSVTSQHGLFQLVRMLLGM